MESRNWSSSIVRTLVLIAGVIVVLEALHVISISVTWHMLASDFKANRNIPEIVGGLAVGSLALIPSRKNRVRKIHGPTILRWSSINTVDSVQRLMCLTNFTAHHTDIR